MKRRAWRIERAGRIDGLRLVEEEPPPLSDDHVRVRVRAAGLNFADIFALTGLYSATPKGSFVPGLELAGEVLACGDAVPEGAIAPGRRVLGCVRFGGYAEVVDAPASQLRLVPEGWSFDQGAAFPVQTLTAWYALSTLGAVRPGQVVLVHSAAGGVGLRCMEISRIVGAHPIGTVSDPAKKEFLAARGDDEVIVRGGDFADELKAVLAGRPLHLVLDAIGGRVQRESFEALAPTGRMVAFGAAEFAPVMDACIERSTCRVCGSTSAGRDTTRSR